MERSLDEGGDSLFCRVIDGLNACCTRLSGGVTVPVTECCGSSVVEHSIGNGEVESSILSRSTIPLPCFARYISHGKDLECPNFHTWDAHMALRMAQPWTHPTTKMIYLRQRTPEDLLPHVRGQKVPLPVGKTMRLAKIGEFVQLSLRTKDSHEAKERHALADAALRQFWLRKRRELEAAGNADTNSTEPAPTMEWGAAVARFGPTADTVLTDEGFPITDANRATIIAGTARLYDAVAAKLGPELGAAFVADRRTISMPPASTAAGPALSIETSLGTTVHKLWDAFASSKAEMLAPKTIRRYAPSLASLAHYCGSRDIKTITGDDIFHWAEHRRDKDGILPRVINRTSAFLLLPQQSRATHWLCENRNGKSCP